LFALTQQSFTQYAAKNLKEQSLLTKELIAGVNRVNYNQVTLLPRALLPENTQVCLVLRVSDALLLCVLNAHRVQDNGLNALAGLVSLCPLVTGTVRLNKSEPNM
jgi:hypothetical protein